MGNSPMRAVRLTPVSSTREFRERPDDQSGAAPGHLSHRRAGCSRRHGNRKHTVHGTHGYRLEMPGEP
jgi:hypothetical protein